jgi:hypothetical protein
LYVYFVTIDKRLLLYYHLHHLCQRSRLPTAYDVVVLHPTKVGVALVVPMWDIVAIGHPAGAVCSPSWPQWSKWAPVTRASLCAAREKLPTCSLRWHAGWLFVCVCFMAVHFVVAAELDSEWFESQVVSLLAGDSPSPYGQACVGQFSARSPFFFLDRTTAVTCAWVFLLLPEAAMDFAIVFFLVELFTMGHIMVLVGRGQVTGWPHWGVWCAGWILLLTSFVLWAVTFGPALRALPASEEMAPD